MAPDSWAFWQGSVSLLDGRGYRLFSHDEAIREWPPLYSVYLAVWQAIFGVSGKVLIASQSLLAGSSAFAWTWLGLTLGEPVPSRSRPETTLSSATVAAFIAAFVATRYDCVRADNLKYVVLPALIAVSERSWFVADRARLLWLSVAIGVLGAVLMLTHTSSIAFVVAALCIILLSPSASFKVRVAAGLLTLLLALTPWQITRVLLGQRGSHQIGVGVAEYGPLQYAIQAVGGSSTLLIKAPWLSVPLGLSIVIASAACFDISNLTRRVRVMMRARALFVVISLAVLYLLFNVTYITDKLTGRFIFFVPLAMIPLAIALLASGRRLLLQSATYALILLAGVPRLVDLWSGVERSREARGATPEQFALAADCIRRPDGAPSWRCSEQSAARVPPSGPAPGSRRTRTR